MDIITIRIRNALLTALLCSALSCPSWAAGAAPATRQPPPSTSLATNDVLVKEFPFAACTARNISLTPYRMTAPVGPINETTASVTYCFGVTAIDSPALNASTHPCAQMLLNKIELIINEDCYEETPKAVRIANVNGLSAFPTYSKKNFNGKTYSVISIGHLNALFNEGPILHLQACLVMRKGRACSTPQTLCYGTSCVYSLFNADRSCCPASQVSRIPSL